ncbi:MAG TPA: PAS domain-containing sensor histidine kinase, partial [Cryomorphaceae bacterium]|nr:PAS domain-containing sensor histidine kinase [Cryomorphaceae bacterium]
METMIQKISEGIIGLDAEFNVLFINPFAKKLLGISRQKIKGLSAKDLSLQNPIFQNTIQDLLESSITSDRRYTRNKLIKGNLDNKTAYFIRKVIITYADSDDDHELNGYIIMLKNITEYKEMDQAKTNFIATVSHELKTPISAIKMSLRLLKDQRLGRLEEEQEEMVESIEWETNRLLNITQELLNATEMEGGEIKLNLEPTRPEDIVEEAIDSVITLAEDRNVIIEKEVDSNLPNILVDEDKVTWVLVNFLTNSIKYSPVGSRVDIKVTYDQEFIEFSVKDQGTGIPEEHQKRIFDRYYRIPGSGGKGTGLGLSISKELINKMGGKIGLESNPGKGARFYFRLFETSVNEVPLNKRA